MIVRTGFTFLVCLIPLSFQQQNGTDEDNTHSYKVMTVASTPKELRTFYKDQSLGPLDILESVAEGRRCMVVCTYPFSGLRASEIFVYVGKEGDVCLFRMLAYLQTIDRPSLKPDAEGWVVYVKEKEILRLRFDS